MTRGGWATRSHGRANINHGVPEAWERAERTDTVGLCLAQDVAEVHRRSADHADCHLADPAEVLLLCFAENTADHVHVNAKGLSQVALGGMEVGHHSNCKVVDTIGNVMSNAVEDVNHD